MARKGKLLRQNSFVPNLSKLFMINLTNAEARGTVIRLLAYLLQYTSGCDFPSQLNFKALPQKQWNDGYTYWV